MIKQLETNYLEKQLALALDAKQTGDWSKACAHYQKAYSEAVWLCEHFIDGGCSSFAKTAYELLQTAAEGCMDSSDDPSTIIAIEGDLLRYKTRMRCEFGMHFSHNASRTSKKNSVINQQTH